MSKKFISDTRIKNDKDFSKLYDNLDISTLDSILESQPNLVNKRDDKSGLTILFTAVLTGNYSVVQHLLENRSADPNVQNVYGETPLHHAVENSNHKLINLLLERGANPNIQQQEGETAMHIAAIKGDYKVIKLLHLYGGDPLIRTFSMSYSVLDYATERANAKCIEVITDLMGKKSKNTNSTDNYTIVNNSQFTNNLDFQDERTGLQTTKNSDSPLDRFKNNIDMSLDRIGIGLSSNNTAKNSRNNNLPSNKSRLINRERNLSCNFNPLREDFQLRGGARKDTGKSSKGLKEENKANNHHNAGESSFINQMNNFEERLEKIKKELMDNVISNTEHIGNTEQIGNTEHTEHIGNTEQDLINPITNSNKKENLNIIKHHNYFSLLTNSDSHNHSGLKSPASNSSKHKINFNKFKHAKKNGYNSASLPSNLNYDYLIHSHNTKKQQQGYSSNNSKQEDISNSHLNSCANANSFANLNAHNFSLLSLNKCTTQAKTDSEDKQFAININMNMDDNRMITLRQEEDEEDYAYPTSDLDEDKTRITYLKENNALDEIYNLPLKRNSVPTNNYSVSSLVSYTDLESHTQAQAQSHKYSQSKYKVTACETFTFTFEDYNKVLAVFSSSKNDIEENYVKNKNVAKNENKNLNNKDTALNQKYADLFNFNFNELNEFILNTEDVDGRLSEEEDEEEDEECEGEEQVDKFIQGQVEVEDTDKRILDTLTDKTATFYRHPSSNNESSPGKQTKVFNTFNNTNNTNKLKIPINKVKYFSKSNSSIKDDFKHISLDTQNINEISVSIYQKSPNTDQIIVSSDTMDRMNINFEQIRKDGSGLIELEYNTTEAFKEINFFLKALDLERYTQLFIFNGFDDLRLVIDQMKSDMAITDQNLRDIGITVPGHRAKILLRLEEECKNFDFCLPSNVFFTLPDILNQSTLDINAEPSLMSLYNWLASLKMENFLLNFIINGYHSVELLWMQMISKNPLSEKVLEEELGIDKIGYRIRILNKLKDDSKVYLNKLKSKLNMTDKKESTQDSCRCVIF